jgi:WhiB family transcriptional regulator, redox-sensing transcriptional regulator
MLPCEDSTTYFIDKAIDDPHIAEHAIRMCQTCDNQKACYNSAIESGFAWGVWGGKLFIDGRPLKKIPNRKRKNRSRSDTLCFEPQS